MMVLFVDALQKLKRQAFVMEFIQVYSNLLAIQITKSSNQISFPKFR